MFVVLKELHKMRNKIIELINTIDDEKALTYIYNFILLFKAKFKM